MNISQLKRVVLTAAAGSVLAGCAGLEHKSVVVDSSVQGFKVTAGADASGGAPLPNISAGWGRSLLITMPAGGAGTLEYESESGSLFGEFFGIEVKDKTRVLIFAGNGESDVGGAGTPKNESADAPAAVIGGLNGLTAEAEQH